MCCPPGVGDGIWLHHMSTPPMVSLCVLCSKPLQSYLTLCDLIVCCPPGSSVRGILQAKCVAMLSSRGSSQAWDGTQVSCHSCIAGGFFTAEPWGSPHSLIAVPSLYWRRSFLIGSHLFRQWLFCRQLWFGCACERRWAQHLFLPSWLFLRMWRKGASCTLSVGM